MSEVKRTRCPKGTRKNKRTGKCEKDVTKEIVRCPRGTRKNKQTGKCDSVLDNTCAICLDRITSSNVKTQCKHNFHKKCLVGWCKSNEKGECPICRGDIKATCKKIMPFDSSEVFRFIPNGGGRMNDVDIEQAEKIMKHKDFDVNVRRPHMLSFIPEFSGKTWSVLESLLLTKNTVKLIEYLLQQPGIEVEDELVSRMIAGNSHNMLKLFKKYKKIPKHLKNLI
jgi:hypothetical protein